MLVKFISIAAILIGVSAQAAENENTPPPQQQKLSEQELRTLIDQTLQNSVLLKCQKYFQFDVFLSDLLNAGGKKPTRSAENQQVMLNFIRTHLLKRRAETAQEAVPSEVSDKCQTIAQAVTDAGIMQSALILQLLDEFTKQLQQQSPQQQNRPQ